MATQSKQRKMATLRERLAQARPTERMPLPGTEGGPGNEIEVRSMSVGQRSRYVDHAHQLQAHARKAGNKTEVNAEANRLVERVFTYVAFDPESGEQLFPDEDDAAVQELDSGFVDTVATRGLELSGVDMKAHANAKNDSEVSSVSPTNSPPTSE